MNTREEKRFGDLGAALPEFAAYLAVHPEPVLVIDPFTDTQLPTPYETPEGFSLKEAAKQAQRIDDDARVYWLSGQVISVGRTSDNDLVLDHPSVSKVHAAFREDDARWHVEDTHSTQGTSVNAVRIEPLVPRLLRSADWLGFGEVRARFFLPKEFWEAARRSS